MKKYALALVTILLIGVIGAVNIFAVPGVKLNKKNKTRNQEETTTLRNQEEKNTSQVAEETVTKQIETVTREPVDVELPSVETQPTMKHDHEETTVFVLPELPME